MRGRVSRPRACRSQLNLPKASQEKRLDAIASRTQGMHVERPCSRKLEYILIHGAELPPGRGGRYPAGGGVAQDTTPLQSSKRALDPASTNDSSPAKRARLTWTDTQRRERSIMYARLVKHARASGTGPSRRSARLRGEQPASSRNSVPPSRASFGWQIEAGTGASSSKRLGLTKRNAQPEAEEEQTEQATETAQQPRPPSDHPTRFSKPGSRNRGESHQRRRCGNGRSTATAAATNSS
ncbi:hypothetical protein GE09DRAFT_317900 [Coniochaeta sp. 2T2.1]|nr:hypothetical protein GE09DRAFT_317900 [Coniochaeta sp. 2T2.1]